MDTDRQAIADQILQRRLNQILEEELTVPSNSDESLVRIDLCNSLLWQLSNHGECNYQDHLAERKEVVSQKYQFYKRRKALVSHERANRTPIGVHQDSRARYKAQKRAPT